MTKDLKIGLLGLGTVGGALVRLLLTRAEQIERAAGLRIHVKRAAARTAGKSRPASLAAGALTYDPFEVVRDPEVDLVVELLGGINPARALVREALAAKKPVVTANKQLLAEHGEELFAEAERSGVALRFEGAVCGGLPVIRTLRDALAADRVASLHGILNGTTNHVLSRMTEGGGSFGAALAEAQAEGYAEADPTLDVGGFDAAQKLCLLARLAFGARVRPQDVLTEGIERIGPQDVAAARELGCVVKLLALARWVGGALDLRVHPAMIRAGGPLASVGGASNALLVEAEALGSTLLSGPGAGGACTAAAVAADIVDVGRPGAGAPLPFTAGRDVPLLPHDQIAASYYLRFTVDDAPGVLAGLTAALGKRDISIAALHQRERREGREPVSVVLLTHRAREGAVQAAVAEIDKLPTTRGRTQLIRVETEKV